LKLANLIKCLKSRAIKGQLGREISDIAYDSRKVQPGSLFVAIRGTKTDGHLYIDAALNNGAVGLVVESRMDYANIPVIGVPDSRRALARLAMHFYDYPASKLKIIGVTGTNGKTTTALMIGEILKAHGKIPGVIGTLYIRVGEETFSTNITTPESLEIQKFLAMMVDEGVKIVAMEVSSHSLYFDRVEGIEFQGAVFTNFSQDHLDFHLDLNEYFEQKKSLFRKIVPRKYGGFAILNSDDIKTPEIVDILDVPYSSFGIYRHPDVRAKNIHTDVTGTSFVAESDRWDIPVKMKLLGTFNIYNALAAIATSLHLNIPPAAISRGLNNMKIVRGRFETVNEGQPFDVLVDYAHTPDGLEKALQSARKLAQNRLIVVFGCGGDRDNAKRPVMGEHVAEYADFAIITSDNPRNEDPMSIISDIQPGIEKGNIDFMIEVDRETAIYEAIEMAEPGDLVLIAGKGHETYQIFRNETINFDDVQVAREAIRKMINV